MKYINIKNDIVKDINKGILTSYDISGSEKNLCEKFGVSRVTLRKIFTELEKEGYLKKIKNKGWIINNVKSQDITKIHSFTEAITNNGYVPRIELIEKKICDEVEEKKLGNSKNGFLQIERLYLADETPYCITVSTLSLEHLPNIKYLDFSNESLYKMLKELYNIEIVEVTQIVDSAIVTPRLSELLKLDVGTSCLKLNAIVRGKIKDKVFTFESYESYIRTDKIRYTTNKSL